LKIDFIIPLGLIAIVILGVLSGLAKEWLRKKLLKPK